MKIEQENAMCAVSLAAVLTILLPCILLQGCKTVTKVIPVTETITETKYVTDYAHDTLIVRDSVWVKEKGDTVTIDRWHTRDRIVYTNKVDSFIRVDSIPVVTEVEIPVHVRSGYDRFCSWFMWIVVASLLAIIGWKIFRKVYLHA